VLKLTAGVWVNIYMDFKYAFTTIHVHGTLYKKGGSLAQEEKMLSRDKKS
jgi:hypothetical protein